MQRHGRAARVEGMSQLRVVDAVDCFSWRISESHPNLATTSTDYLPHSLGTIAERGRSMQSLQVS